MLPWLKAVKNLKILTFRLSTSAFFRTTLLQISFFNTLNMVHDVLFYRSYPDKFTQKIRMVWFDIKYTNKFLVLYKYMPVINRVQFRTLRIG